MKTHEGAAGALGMSPGAVALAKNGVEEPTLPKREDLDLDLDALTAPDYVSHVSVKGVRYGVLSLIDVPNDEALEALKLDQDIRDQSFDEQLRRTRRQIQILVPSMPPDVLGKLTTRQMIRVAAEATGAARRPTGAEPGAQPSSSGSASPEPEPAGSTDGVTTK